MRAYTVLHPDKDAVLSTESLNMQNQVRVFIKVYSMLSADLKKQMNSILSLILHNAKIT